MVLYILMSIRIHKPDTWGDSEYWKKRIGLARPMKFGSRSCQMIEYNGRLDGRFLSKSLVIQTPWMYLPYYPLIDDKGHASVDLALWQTESGPGPGPDPDFFAKLGQLHRVIIDAFGEVDATSVYIDPIRPVDRVYPARLKLRGVPWKDMLVFDGMCERIENRLRPEQRIRCLLTLRYIWDNGEMHGFKYELTQVQIADYEMRQCALPQVVSAVTIDEKYVCYEKMKRAGVAVPAICHKMMMDGMNQRDIAKWRDGGQGPQERQERQEAQKDTPKPVPRISMSAILLGKSQLKNKDNCDKPRIESSNMPAPHKGASAFTAPTMAQLLEARTGLRKIKISDCG